MLVENIYDVSRFADVVGELVAGEGLCPREKLPAMVSIHVFLTASGGISCQELLHRVSFGDR